MATCCKNYVVTLWRRRQLLWVAILLGLFFISPRPAAAQTGCPDGLTDVGTPRGTRPGDAAACINQADDTLQLDIYRLQNDKTQCGDSIAMTGFLTAEWSEFYYSSGNNDYPNELARVSFILSIRERLLVNVDEIRVQISVYDGLTATNDPTVGLISSTILTPVRVDPIGDRWINAEFDTQSSFIVVPRRYSAIRLKVAAPTPAIAEAVYLSGVQILPPNVPHQRPCDPTPPTPTPTRPLPTAAPPTATPDPAATATATPTITPTSDPNSSPTPTQQPPLPTRTPRAFPTAEGGTPPPLPTATPYQRVPVAAQPTGTAVPIVQYEQPQFPQFTAPNVPNIGGVGAVGVGLTPNATRQAQNEQVETWITDATVMSNSWITNTTSAVGWLNPELTAGTGISTPLQIGEQMASTFVQPISTVRALAIYMPNLWPYLLMIFLLLLWIFFNLLFKFGIAIVESVSNFLYSLWEAIPFN